MINETNKENGKVKRKRAPKGKGKFEDIMFKDLTPSERELLSAERDKHKVIQAQIDRLTIQEVRVISQVQETRELSDEDCELKSRSVSELMKELATVQKMKAQALELQHKMTIDDMKYGLAQNVEAEAAKESAREVIKALSGEAAMRELDEE